MVISEVESTFYYGVQTYVPTLPFFESFVKVKCEKFLHYSTMYFYKMSNNNRLNYAKFFILRCDKILLFFVLTLCYIVICFVYSSTGRFFSLLVNAIIKSSTRQCLVYITQVISSTSIGKPCFLTPGVCIKVLPLFFVIPAW